MILFWKSFQGDNNFPLVRKVDRNGEREYYRGAMEEKKLTFGELFKKFRLKSGFATLEEFGNALAEEGYVFENSLFSHWQKNSRTPKDRKLLLTIIKIFIKKKGIYSAKNINNFLESVSQGYLTEEESEIIDKEKPNFFVWSTSIKKTLDFLTVVNESKKILRSGWIREGIKDAESVAEHSFQLSVMAMVFSDQFGVDRDKLIKMAILHDLGEVVTGDIVWARGKIIDIEKRKKKEDAEIQGITKIFKPIGLSNEYKNILEEMIERKSQEAKIFWQLDKLEMAMQALQYEKEYGKKLDEFFVNAGLQIYSPFLKKIFKQILRERPNMSLRGTE